MAKKEIEKGAFVDLAKEAGVNAGYVSAYDKWQKGDREGLLWILPKKRALMQDT